MNQGIGPFSKSPVGREIEVSIKNKNNNQQSNYFKSQIKGKERNKYNLNLKKILHKRALESDRDKGLISERIMPQNKLLEKLERYFLKSNNINTNPKNSNIKVNNYFSNNKNNINHNMINNNKNINKNNYNRNNILYKNFTKNTNTNNDQHNKLMTKIISKNYNNSNDKKTLRNKTNNNTPLKRNYNKFLYDNKQNMLLSPQNNEQFRKMPKPLKKQKFNYNNLMSNLNDINNIVFDANKFLINSERNKNYKIIFK